MSSSPHYYNENHIPTAYWLRKLIAEGHLPAGDVDTRSIEDVAPEDLDGYTQHHFFAGIGGWALALKLAGWPVDEPIWTGSCPCQPFSSAGEKAGFADERHLWPAFEWLIGQRLPKRVVGEQVAGKDADPWIDLVQADMEAMGYAFGAVAFPAAGIGSPQIRDRTYWVADADHAGSQGRVLLPECTFERAAGVGGLDGGLADASGHGREMAVQHDLGGGAAAGEREANVAGGVGTTHGPGPTNGYWRDADWVGCQGGKWRPVEPGTFPLAHGVSERMVRLRGYGNAVNVQSALEFIKAVYL